MVLNTVALSYTEKSPLSATWTIQHSRLVYRTSLNKFQEKATVKSSVTVDCTLEMRPLFPLQIHSKHGLNSVSSKLNEKIQLLVLPCWPPCDLNIQSPQKSPKLVWKHKAQSQRGYHQYYAKVWKLLLIIYIVSGEKSQHKSKSFCFPKGGKTASQQARGTNTPHYISTLTWFSYKSIYSSIVCCTQEEATCELHKLNWGWGQKV